MRNKIRKIVGFAIIAVFIFGILAYRLAGGIQAVEGLPEGTGVNFSESPRFAYSLEKPFAANPNTFEAWIRIPANLADGVRGGVISGNYCAGNFHAINWEVYTNGNVRVYWNNGQVDYIFTNVDVRTGNWEHIAIVRNPALNNITLYLNGVNKGSSGSAGDDVITTNFSHCLGFDRAQWTTKYPFKGEIARVSVYSSVRSEPEIITDITDGPNVFDSSLMGDWQLASKQQTIYDSSSNKNNANLIELDNYYTADYNMADGDYTMIVLPDTQRIARLVPANLSSMLDWVVNNKESLNLQFVMHTGDIADGGGNALQSIDMKNTASALNKLDVAGIPYSLVLGNHDYDDELASTRNSILFNSFYRFSKNSQKSTFSGYFEYGKIDNTYYKFEVKGIKYIVMALELGPRDSVLSWASKVVEQNPDYRVIITTHAYMSKSGELLSTEDDGDPLDYGYRNTTSVNNPAEMWNKFMKKYSNIQMVISGHMITDDIVYKISTGDNGNKVAQVLVNGQGVFLSNGQTLLLVMKFSNNGQTVDLYYYNPLTGKYFNAQNRITLDLSRTVG